MRYPAVIFAFLMLATSYCAKEKNPLDASSEPHGDGNLVIKTDQDVYSWQQGGSDRFIVIQGTLENRSATTFYSQIGDGFGAPEQEHVFVAANSAGHVEKYDASTTGWSESDIAALLIEGSRFVPLAPAKSYTIHAHLFVGIGRVEKGQYRLRIDYYQNTNPSATAMPMRDYSNVFVIE